MEEIIYKTNSDVSQERVYNNYISSLKGIACVCVMLGHFLGIIKYASSLPQPIMQLFNFLNKLHIGFLIDESFWLYLFFIISGYLCARTKIKSLLQLIYKIIFRFLRLAMPILCVNVFIFLIYKTIGFHNQETITIINNYWFQSAYLSELSFISLLKSPIDTLIFSNCYFNSPFWVLRNMLFASIFIYVCSYLKSKIRKDWIYAIGIFVVLIAFYVLDLIIFACFVGGVLTYYNEQIKNNLTKNAQIAILIITVVLYVLLQNVLNMILLFSSIVLFIPNLKLANNMLEHKSLDYLGKISFGIYSFHWPIYCSISSLVLIYTHSSLGAFSFLLMMLVGFVCTFTLAILYYHFIEKYIFILLKKLEKLLMKKKVENVKNA